MNEYYKQKRFVKAFSKRDKRIDDEMNQILAKAFLSNL